MIDNNRNFTIANENRNSTTNSLIAKTTIYETKETELENHP